MSVKYDVNFINSIVDNFKNKNYSPSDITIYFDLDNTLALMSVFGKEREAVEKMYGKGFFKNLPCFAEVPFVVESLQKMGFKIKILSACVATRYCRSEKTEWVKFHIPSIKDEDIILMNVGDKKNNFIKEDISRCILVDDYHVNINDWYKQGGVAIKKSYSGKNRGIPQVENLIEMFAVLYSLNCLNNKEHNYEKD